MGYIDDAKQWFKTRLKPTQNQFWQTFQWLRWKDEKLPMSDVTDLITTLNQKADIGVTGVNKPIGIALTGDGFIDIPEGLLIDFIIITPTGDITPLFGTTPAGYDFFQASEPIVANTDYLLTVSKTIRATTRLYITGITSPTVILIYTRTLSYQ